MKANEPIHEGYQRLLAGYTDGGEALFVDMLRQVFCKLDTEDKVAVHNYIWSKIAMLIGSHQQEFYQSAAREIESLARKVLINEKSIKG